MTTVGLGLAEKEQTREYKQPDKTRTLGLEPNASWKKTIIDKIPTFLGFHLYLTIKQLGQDNSRTIRKLANRIAKSPPPKKNGASYGNIIQRALQKYILYIKTPLTIKITVVALRIASLARFSPG